MALTARVLDRHIKEPGIAQDRAGPLSRTGGRISGTPQRMTQPDAYRMIQEFAIEAGVKQSRNAATRQRSFENVEIWTLGCPSNLICA